MKQSVARGARSAPSGPQVALQLPLISVVTVAYNDASNLEATIRSVARQSYPRVEHIIIDGGSTDGSVDIVRSSRAPLMFWTSEPDDGVYDAMNKGIAAAKGDWITFLNAGDTYFDGEILTDIFDRSAEAAASDLVYGDVFTVDSDGTLLRRERARSFTGTGLKGGLPANHQTILVRRSRCPRYDLRYRISSDLDWAISIFGVGGVKTFYFSDRPMVYYRVGGMSSLRTEGTWEAMEIIARRFGFIDALLRTPIFIRWLIAAYLKRAFHITTLKRFMAPKNRRQTERQRIRS